MATEVEFAGNFLSLLGVSDSTIKITQDYKKDLKTLPSISFITAKNLPKKRSRNAKQSSTKTLHFKSIKPPKFNEDLTFEENKTIWEVKDVLSKKLGLHSEQLKFLIKGKVIQDSVIVADLPDVKFVVMVKEEEKKDSEPEPEPEPELDDASELQWSDIEKVLRGKFSEDVVHRLQKGWELTK